MSSAGLVQADSQPLYRQEITHGLLICVCEQERARRESSVAASDSDTLVLSD